MKLVTRYEKAPSHRVVHADGCVGGVSPRGDIRCAFYSERFPLPSATSFEVGGTAWIEKVEALEGNGAERMRSYELDLVFDLHTAISVYAWLGTKIEQLRKLKGVPDGEWQKLMGEATLGQAAEQAFSERQQPISAGERVSDSKSNTDRKARGEALN